MNWILSPSSASSSPLNPSSLPLILPPYLLPGIWKVLREESLKMEAKEATAENRMNYSNQTKRNFKENKTQRRITLVLRREIGQKKNTRHAKMKINEGKQENALTAYLICTPVKVNILWMTSVYSRIPLFPRLCSPVKKEKNVVSTIMKALRIKK